MAQEVAKDFQLSSPFFLCHSAAAGLSSPGIGTWKDRWRWDEPLVLGQGTVNKGHWYVQRALT